MPKLTIDDATYAAWQAQAAASGLDIVEWLKRQTKPQPSNGNAEERPVDELTPAERLARLDEFEATLVGQDGNTDFNREELWA